MSPKKGQKENQLSNFLKDISHNRQFLAIDGT